ncbi:FAD-binding oxidoreductase [Streptomyces sp. NPDC021093]|uniref:FAD-binding oxidoreductase n=1 Tax=Streptomyces sp. NPDC021093 TaxID=3365112 RepID=UPI0037992C0A
MINRRTFLATSAGAGLVTSGLVMSGPALGSTAGARTRVRSGPVWGQLRDALRGDLVLPGDAGYDKAKQLATAQFDHVRPQAVAYCETAEDVRACVNFAREGGIPCAVRSGGHSFTGWSTSEGLVINLTRLNTVRATAPTVRVGPGIQTVDAVAALSPLGLTVPAGFCPSVSPGGFVTGGGMGWQFRKYGPASDRLISAQVVLADGRIVTASEQQDADLLWALRGGGGGNFGVVTDFEMAPTKETHVVTFDLTWPWDQAQKAFTVWQDWATAAPVGLSSRAGVVLRDAAPGKVPTLIINGAHFGGQAELEAQIAALTSAIGSPPTTSEVKERAYDKAMMRLFGCETRTVEQCHISGSNPEAQLPRDQFVRHRSRMFSASVPGSGVADMLAAFDADRTAGQFRYLGFLSLGGNANKVAPGDTAYVHRDAEHFAVFNVALGTPQPEPEALARALSWVDSGFAAMDPHSNGRTYVNYPDPALADWQQSYYGGNLARLRSVKRAYDPNGFFRFPQGVPA